MKKKYKPSFSVIIIFGDYSSQIDDYLKNYLKYFENFQIEIIVVSENIKKLNVKSIFPKDKIKLLYSNSPLPSYKRNLGVSHATKEYIVFIDDDAYPSDEYFKVAEEICSKGHFAFGGPQIAPRENNNFISDLSDSFFSNKLTNPFNFRYNLNGKNKLQVKELPTVNFIIKKELFIKLGGFDTKFWPGEDTILCDSINKFSKIYYFTNLFVYHARRDSLIKHLRQISRYGYNRGKLIFKLKKVFSLYYFFPLLFLSLILPFFVFFKFSILFLISIYAILVFSEDLFKKRKILISILLPILCFMSFALYGLNFLIGLFDFSDKKVPRLGR